MVRDRVETTLQEPLVALSVVAGVTTRIGLLASTILTATRDPTRSAIAKVTARLIPFLFLLYLLNFLDRVNVGFAALSMNRDLGFGPAVGASQEPAPLNTATE